MKEAGVSGHRFSGKFNPSVCGTGAALRLGQVDHSLTPPVLHRGAPGLKTQRQGRLELSSRNRKGTLGVGLGGVTQEVSEKSVFTIGQPGSSAQKRKIKKHATKRKRYLWLMEKEESKEEWEGLLLAMHRPKHIIIITYLIFRMTQ